MTSFMHNFLNCRLFSRDVRLELDNLYVADSTGTGKPKGQLLPR